MRLFIAINLPPEIRERLKAAQAELAEQISQKAVVWTKPDQFHLTLNFLGDVEVEKVPSLLPALHEAGGRFAPLDLTIAGIGLFPHGRRPRVIWAGVQSDGHALFALQEGTTNSVREICAEPDEKNFVGHITIGRCKELTRSETRTVVEFAEVKQAVALGSWTASSFELMRSELSPNGATHTVYESIPLGKVQTL
jgi:2'-5' RNA ligase